MENIGIRDKHPGSATLVFTKRRKNPEISVDRTYIALLKNHLGLQSADEDSRSTTI
jgi:hypothetical protein